MESLVSNWYPDQSLPETYIFPPEKRPGKLIFPPCKTIPVVDLGKAAGCDRAEIVQQIFKASQEVGFFQVINHGISGDLLHDSMSVCREFFDMPASDKANFYSEDPSRGCRLSTSSLQYPNEEIHLWRDFLRLPCHPLEDCMQFWPDKPTKYREIIGAYSIEVRKLSSRILELICEGLGLGPGYFVDELSGGQMMLINNYPPCPEPSLTLGLAKHADPSLITILQQGDVCGLQVFKDGQWVGVEPLPNAFVVNIGSQLQVISNGKLRSVEHRAVTNSSDVRTTIVTFINPSSDCIIKPAKALVNEGNPPLYKAFKFKDFFSSFTSKGTQVCTGLDNYKCQT